MVGLETAREPEAAKLLDGEWRWNGRLGAEAWRRKNRTASESKHGAAVGKGQVVLRPVGGKGSDPIKNRSDYLQGP